MNKQFKYHRILFFFLLGMTACNTTKNIPEGQYLLDKINIKSDTKKVNTFDMLIFVSQQPNHSVLGMGKAALGIYNWAGKDSSSNIFHKLWRKIGEPPVIYNAASAKYSSTQMQIQLNNLGYLNATVGVQEKKKDKKAEITYNIHTGTAYTIRNFEMAVSDTAIAKLLKQSLRRNSIKKGDVFNQEVLENRLESFNSMLRNRGYFSLTKESFQYVADTTLNSHAVDLKLTIIPNTPGEASDSVPVPKYKPYKINQVSIISRYDTIASGYAIVDTFTSGKTKIYYDKTHFIKPGTILKNCHIRPGANYNERLADLTYNALNALSCVKQVSVQFREVEVQDSIKLNCLITIISGNIHRIETGIEGTNSAGDLGVGASVTYQHRNIFNGAETFRIKLQGAYEAITGTSSTDLLNENYYEYGIETGISFPRFLINVPQLNDKRGSTDVRMRFNNQLRPEYQRVFFNTGLNYEWTGSRSRFAHSLDIVDINYVAIPQMSKEFRDSVMNNPRNLMLKYSYENLFIYRTAYNLVYTSQPRNARSKDFFTIRAGIELAGNLFYGASKLFKAAPDSAGSYRIFNVPFAQYVKADFDYARNMSIDKKNSIAMHAVVGAAYPYLNSIVLPYEKRYYSGGSNSIRGWSTRQLGPGTYNNNGTIDFMNQSGDLKLDLSVEFRNMLIGPFQVASFIDAGNIWTLRKYDNQPGGQFRLNSFYKQIAWAWGLGFRLDFDFLVFRFDTGMKIYDPAQTGSDRWRITRPDFWNDFAFHFAIGYPF